MRVEEGPSQRVQQTLASATMTLLSLLREAAPELGASISAAVAACGSAGLSTQATLYPPPQPAELADLCVAACTGQLP